MRVIDILKEKGSGVLSVGPDEALADVARVIAQHRKGLAVVRDKDNKLLGVISVIDVNRALADHREAAAKIPVRDLMHRDVVTCEPDDSVESALEKMASRGVRHLPVVDKDILKGLVNIRDVLRCRCEEAEITIEEMHRYVVGAGYH